MVKARPLCNICFMSFMGRSFKLVYKMRMVLWRFIL